MTRSELVAILLSHGIGVEDPEIRVATGPITSEPCSVNFAPSDDAYGPHVRLVPDPGQMTETRKRDLLRWAVGSSIEADLIALEEGPPRRGELETLLASL